MPPWVEASAMAPWWAEWESLLNPAKSQPHLHLCGGHFGQKFAGENIGLKTFFDMASFYHIFIAVMGMTGAGKSTLIQTVTEKDVGVGHTLDSCKKTLR